MMHTIEKIDVEGFWDSYSFPVKIDQNVAFFIGQNGTGKTTLINLIASALTADFRTLDRLPFRKITINLRPIKGNIKPTISVEKTKRKDRPVEIIEYTINTGKPHSKERRFSLDEDEEQILLRRFIHESRHMEYYRRYQSGIRAELQNLVSVNWLSVHRISPFERAGESRSFESSIDQKLESLSNDLVKYFATLSKSKDDEIRVFQESLFISLLHQAENADPIEFERLQRIEMYKESLQKIFAELHVSEQTASRMSDFLMLADKIQIRSKDSKNKTILLNDALFLASLQRIEDVVRRWGELQDRLKIIFSHRDKFQEIADQLFRRKKMTFSESNELKFLSRSGKTLLPQMLSSGEKQLLILMSETLLQRQNPAIFIADEPELSLHVIWQERLIGSLRALNPNAQIIVATHSPDIVGNLTEKTIDMEDVIK
ncbi:AAA family ATPase [Roseomonas sp. HF4]|uniref:AAA family ATPase n=1 Tax=Roseomonas sp. HF4 TaxID=2562313 RepID=UPI0010C0B90F|nr:AAA family ATPase [Roseomonas sp. HF4]